MTRRLLMLAIAGTLSLTGCSQSSTPTSEATPASSEAPTSPTDPAPSPTETTPAAVSYTDRQLVAALPSTAAERHGEKAQTTCLTIDQPCREGQKPGSAYVLASNKGANYIDVAVVVTRRSRTASTEKVTKDCPQGRYLRPLKEISKTEYAPGQKGTSTRADFSIGAWSGFACEKDVVYLWPKRDQSEPTKLTYTFLDNGKHTIRTDGRTLEEAKALATEYLERLEGSAED